MRDTFQKPLNTAAAFLKRLGFTANSITIIGLFVNIAAAILIAYGKLTAGGLVLLIGAPMDALDGALARLNGTSSAFGAFLDSVIDRYAELILFAGLLVHFLQIGNVTACILVFVAAVEVCWFRTSKPGRNHWVLKARWVFFAVGSECWCSSRV